MFHGVFAHIASHRPLRSQSLALPSLQNGADFFPFTCQLLLEMAKLRHFFLHSVPLAAFPVCITLFCIEETYYWNAHKSSRNFLWISMRDTAVDLIS